MALGRRRPLLSPGGRLVAGIAAIAAFVALWVYLAPIQVGGSATYSITAGISMQPLLHKDDLALVRAQQTYAVGDVVLYRSRVLNEPVLHRIIVIQNGHYFFKGDNNDFVDPGYVTRSDLVGKLWIHVPVVGGVLGWIGKPWHAAILAGLTTVFLLFGGVATHRRRRRRRGPLTPAEPSHALAPGSRAHAARYMLPAGRATLGTLGVLLIVGLVSTGFGFAAPADRPGTLAGAYRQAGTFSYRAKLLAPSDAYPSGVIVTGQPIFRKLVDSTNYQFAYRFVSRLPHAVHGTIEVNALVLSDASKWENLYKPIARTAFSGDVAQAGGDFPLKRLYGLLAKLAVTSGISGGVYSLSLQPVVHVVGTVGGKPIDTTFAPTLPFTVTPTAQTLDVATTAIVPGATYTPSTRRAALSATLSPVQAGGIPRRVENHLTFARYQIPVGYVRLFGLLELALAVAFAIFHDRILRRQSQRPVEEQIAAHLGCLVTPIGARVLPAGALATPVHDFTSLAQLSRYLERPILRQSDAAGSTYAVDDELRYYEYRALPSAKLRAPVPPARRAHFGAVAHGARRPSRFAVAAAAFALLIAITVVTSFTAKNTVPTTSAGATLMPLTALQGLPYGCSSLSINNLVIRSGTYTNTASHSLILGSSGVDRITDNGTANCIVGGGGRDVIKTRAGTYCVVGPTYGASYMTCSRV